MSSLKKIITSLVLIVMVFSVSPAMALTFTDVVNLLQAPDINLPTGVTNPKGNIGFILSNLFWGTADGTKNGKIKPQYLDYSGISSWTQSGTITYLTASTGSVGIGTPNPGEYSTAIRGIDDTATKGALWVSGQTATTPGLMVRNDGNVGIGTAIPSNYLHIKGSNIASRGQLTLEGSDFTQMTFYKDATTRSMSFYQNQADGSLVLANAINNGNISNIITGAGSFFFQGGNGLITTINGSAPANSLYINSSGNVGIGTASPGYKLHIAGSNNILKLENTDGTTANNYSLMALQSGNQQNLIWTNNQNSVGYYGGNGSLNIYTGQASPIAFFTNGANERMRIDAVGNVGIGTTTPTYKLSLTQGVGVITSSATVNDYYLPVTTGGAKIGVADNVVTPLFKSGYDTVFTLHIVAKEPGTNSMLSKTYAVSILYGSPLITQLQSNNYSTTITSLNIAYDNPTRTIRATIDTTGGQSTNVYWSINGIGALTEGKFEIQ